MGKKIVHVEFAAQDPDRAEKFWEGVGSWSIEDVGMPGIDYRMFQEGDAGGAAMQSDGNTQGPVIYWTANHRRHHVHADRPGDPHSPHVNGERPCGRWCSVGWKPFETRCEVGTMKADLERALREIAEEVPPTRQVPPGLLPRAKRRIALTLRVTLMALSATGLGTYAAVQAANSPAQPSAATPCGV